MEVAIARRPPGRPPKPRPVEDFTPTVAAEPPPGFQEPPRTHLIPRRFRADMMDEWLLGRLKKLWPGTADATWRGKLAGFSASNEYLFIANDNAVLLMMMIRQPMNGHPIAMEVFAWDRSAAGEWLLKWETMALMALYRRAREWTKSFNGERMIVGICSDIGGPLLVELLGAKAMSLAEVRL